MSAKLMSAKLDIVCKIAECFFVIAICVSVAAVHPLTASLMATMLTNRYFASTSRSRLVRVPNFSQVQRNILNGSTVNPQRH